MLTEWFVLHLIGMWYKFWDGTTMHALNTMAEWEALLFHTVTGSNPEPNWGLMWFSSVPSRQYPGQHPNSGQDNFLTHAFQVNQSHYNFILQSKPLRVLLNKPCKMCSFEDFSLSLAMTAVASIILLLLLSLLLS